MQDQSNNNNGQAVRPSKSEQRMHALSTAETLLEELIQDHGIEQVEADLAKLIGSAKWADYLTLCATARHIYNRLQRRKETAQ